MGKEVLVTGFSTNLRVESSLPLLAFQPFHCTVLSGNLSRQLTEDSLSDPKCFPEITRATRRFSKGEFPDQISLENTI